MRPRLLCTFICVLICTTVYGEVGVYATEYVADSIDQTYTNEPSYPDIEQLVSEHDTHLQTDPRKAFKAIKDAADLADQTFSNQEELSHEQVTLWQRCEILLANAFYNKGKYLEAEEHLHKVVAIEESISDSKMATIYSATSRKLDSILETMSFSKAKKWLHDIAPLEKAGDKIEETGTTLQAAREARLFRNYAANGLVKSAEIHYQEAITLYRQAGNTKGLDDLASEYEAWKKDLPPLQEDLAPSLIDSVIEAKPNLRLESLREEAIAIENSAKLKGSSALLEQYKALQNEIAEEEKKNAITLLENQNQLENQEREILLLEQENELSQLTLDQEILKSEESARNKRYLIIGLGLLSALAISLLILYKNKTQSNNKLKVARDDLTIAKERISSLLNEQVSADIADALIEGGITGAQEQFVTIMFLDIRGFTPKVAQLKPEEINKYQNDVFGFMIDIVESHHGNINQLLGDGFMATFGAPKSVGNDVQNAFDAGLEIRDRLSTMNKEGIIPDTQIGIGIDCGKAVMGNVGNDTRKQFSITGNVVISAARIEQANKLIGSNMLISKAVKERIKVQQKLIEHEVLLKGRSSEKILFQVL